MAAIALTAEAVIDALNLAPHPEGGHYRETFRDSKASAAGRSASTAIYFLLRAGEVSAWHRIDSAEVWHWHAGDRLLLETADDAGVVSSQVLGTDLLSGDRPQAVVAPAQWQRARSLGAWTLVGCTVAPGFEFATFELAGDGTTFGGESSGQV